MRAISLEKRRSQLTTPPRGRSATGNVATGMWRRASVAAQDRCRSVNGAHIVSLVRAGAVLKAGKQVETEKAAA